MKTMCLFVFVLLGTMSVFAQSQKGYVYLKNGTILKGKFQYTEDLSKLKIESAGNLWIFDANEVEKVSSLQAGRMQKMEVEKISPFFLRTEIGFLVGNSENSQSAPFSFTTSLNYLVIPKLSLGAGLGLEFLKETYLPVYANFEYKLRDSYATPYAFLKIGYQVALEESNTMYSNFGYYEPWRSSIWPGPDYSNENLDTKGGFLINPGIGYQRMFSSGFGMSFAFGYQFHRLHYKGENDYALDIDYNRLTIKLGIIFN